jgi:geranylgeranyl diphosphate synthase, type I
MLQEDAARALSEEIGALLSPLCGVAGLYDLAREALAQARPGPSSGGGPSWSLLPFVVDEALSGDWNKVVPAAAAIEFFKAAAEVFDDAEDADAPASLASKYGTAAAINAATALLVLGEKALARLRERGVAEADIVHILDVFNSYYLTACAGQYLDLSAGPGAALSEVMYLGAVEMKSGAQVECACWLGATLAGASPRITRLFSRFGQSLGIAVQIANDIQGVAVGKDIPRRKITLPAIYALEQTTGKDRAALAAAFLERSGAAPDAEAIQELLFRTGAMHYATTMMELYRQQAFGSLAAAEQAGARVERLRQLIG